MNARLISSLALSGLVFSLMAGCNQQNATPALTQKTTGGLAVIDLDAVASQLGRDADITKQLKAKQDELNGKIVQAKNIFVNQIKTKQKEFGAEPTLEQKQQLQAMEVQANMTLKQAQSQAVQILQTHRSKLIRAFRDQVTPYAKQVAAQKGMTTIVPKSEMIMSVESSAEISTQVAELMKSQGYNKSQPITPAVTAENDDPAFGGDIQPVNHEVSAPMPE